MNESEIIRSYKQADNKRKQIQILSELNDCPADDIKEILKKHGLIKAGRPKKAETVKKDEPIRETKEDKREEVETMDRTEDSREELLKRLDELEEKLERSKRIEKYQDMANELKAIRDSFEKAGFEKQEAQSMLMTVLGTAIKHGEYL